MEDLPLAQQIIEIRKIAPTPSVAEKLALKELKNLILKRSPFVGMIVHLGTHPKPFTFFLLILIDDEEKTPEHEIGNKIEDNCQYLGSVHAIVHKANSAKEALNNPGTNAKKPDLSNFEGRLTGRSQISGMEILKS